MRRSTTGLRMRLPDVTGPAVDRRPDRPVEAVISVRADGSLIAHDGTAPMILGVEAGHGSVEDAFATVHPDDRRLVDRMLTGLPRRPLTSPPVEVRVRSRRDSWAVVEMRAADHLDDPAVEGIVVTARDVTDRVSLRQAFRTLGDGNQILVRATDESALLHDTCRNIVESGGYLLGWVGYAHHDPDRRVSIEASAGATGYLDGLVVRWGDDARGRGPTGRAIRTGETQVLDDTRLAESFAPWLPRAEAFGVRSSCTLPLVVGGTVIGAMSIYADYPSAFGPDAVALLKQLADDLAYGIGRLRDARSLAASEERFRTVAAVAPVGIVDVAVDATVAYANRAAVDATGLATGDAIDGAWLDDVHPDDRPAVALWARRLRAGAPTTPVDCRVGVGGAWRHVHLSSAQTAHGGHIVVANDVTAEVAIRAELVHQAFHDGLTGLPNRAMLLKRLTTLLDAGRTVAVLFLDLDRMKVINDSVGHHVGDMVLGQVAARLREAAGDVDVVARLGGDEFVVLAQGVDTPAAAAELAERLLACLDAPVRVEGRSFTVTTSIGVLLAGGYLDADTVLRDADAAMYQAKAAGRSRWALFDRDAHLASVEQFALEGELRRAIEHDEFVVFYQPVVAATTGAPCGAEALVRWHHPSRGLVGPDEFITVAEDIGLIGAIGGWVADTALAQLCEWDTTGGPHLDRLAVNLSARQLDDSRTADRLAATLARRGVDARRVVLEVTESALVAEGEQTRRSLDRLKALGVRMEIDDFGTGYSSLAYLHRLPVDGLKVDRTFVARIGGADDSIRVVRAIVEMGHALGLEVVAEGVADARLAAAVADTGCERAQGFHWSPPLPAAAFASWWAAAAG